MNLMAPVRQKTTVYQAMKAAERVKSKSKERVSKQISLYSEVLAARKKADKEKMKKFKKDNNLKKYMPSKNNDNLAKVR